MIKKIAEKIQKKAHFIRVAAHVSPRLALLNMIPSVYNVCPEFFKKSTIDMCMAYVRKHYSYVAQKHLELTPANEPVKDDCPIFVCWLQGEEAMPPVVKACYASIKHFAQNHPVVLITSENLSQWVAIPDHILRKVGEGKITLTHFSDIIRANLIAKYNAIWLDATIYLTAPLNWPATPYHTLKWLSKTGYPISFSGYSPVCKGQPGCPLHTGE